MLKILLLTPILLVLAVACGREQTSRDLQMQALRRQQQLINNYNTSANRIQSQANAKSQEIRDRKNKIRKEANDDKYRHGVLVVGGPFVQKENNEDCKGNSAGPITIECSHGMKGDRKIEDSDLPSLAKRELSKAVSSKAKEEIRIASNATNDNGWDQAVHIGCDDLFSNASMDDWDEFDEEEETSALGCLECPDSVEDDDTGEPKRRSQTFKVARKLNKAAGKMLFKKPKVVKWTESTNSSYDFHQIQYLNGLHGIQGYLVRAETVIMCGGLPHDRLKVAAKNLILHDFNASLKTEPGNWLHFLAYAGTVYLKGSNSITSMGAKNGLGDTQRGPHIRFEANGVFEGAGVFAPDIENPGITPVSLDGTLEIVAKGGSAE